MNQCPFQSQVDAYHDRELPPDVTRRFEDHLPDCVGCAEDLAALDSIGRLLREAPFRPMSQIGMARVHAVADAAAKRREVFPMARGLIVAAASVMVIAGAWLAELPSSPHGSGIATTSRQVQDWERLAAGDRSVIVPQNVQHETGFARAFSNWMIERLQNR